MEASPNRYVSANIPWLILRLGCSHLFMSKMPPRQRLRPWKYAQACTTSSTTIPSRWLSGCRHLPILLKHLHHLTSVTKRQFKKVVRMSFTTQRNCAVPRTRRRRRSLDSHHGGWSGLRAATDVIARNLRRKRDG